MSETAHEHDWQPIGRCHHPHASGVQSHRLYRCACGKYAHTSKPVTFGCGPRRRGPTPPADCPLVDREAWQRQHPELVQR